MIRTVQPATDDLEHLALHQGGYFHRYDALLRHIGDELLSYHARTGRFERVLPGVYRMAIAPKSDQDDLWRALVWSNYRAAISHESALALYGLSDVLPGRVQVTAPPEFSKAARGYQVFHAVLHEHELTEYDGLTVTTAARSIVDAAATGTGPELIVQAVQQALNRGLTTAAALRDAATARRYRGKRLVVPLLDDAVNRADL